MTLEEAKIELHSLVEEYLSCSVIGLDMQVDVRFGEDRCKAIDTVLKALEEQQKEIEEITIENENLTLSQLDLTKRNISKDKIREKIKSIEDGSGLTTYDEAKLNALYELLGE